jgi:hypothetical protein
LCLAAAAVTVGWMLLWLACAAPEAAPKQG